MQQVRGLPGFPSGVRARAQRLPASAPGSRGAQAAGQQCPARGGRGRGRFRRPGASDPLVPALLRCHSRCLPQRPAPAGGPVLMSAIAWSTIANLATALGTLILAVATFSAVRSSNLMARVAREQLLVQLRPVLTTSRREDPTLKVNFGDAKWVRVLGGSAVGEVSPGDGSMGPDTPVVYLALALRNAGNGIAVLHGWRFYPDAHRDTQHAPLEEFQRQNRDLYIPVGDVGFWQGAFRDTERAGYEEARKVIEAHESWTVELLYGDHEGGQRVVSRFTVFPVGNPDQSPDPAHPQELRWLATASRHWNIDRPDPR